MSATIKCLKCGRMTHARVLDDDPETGSMTLEDNIDWKDKDQEAPTTCDHDEYEIIEVEYDPPLPDDVI